MMTLNSNITMLEFRLRLSRMGVQLNYSWLIRSWHVCWNEIFRESFFVNKQENRSPVV